MNLWRGRQYFVAYWQGIFSRLGRVFAVSLLVFILPIFFALLEMRPDLLNMVFLFAGIFTGAVTLLGLFLLPYSVMNALRFAYLSAKYEWRLSESEFLQLTKGKLSRANLVLSLLVFFSPMLIFSASQILQADMESFLWNFLAASLLLIPSFFTANFLGTFLGYYAGTVAESTLSLEKPKRKQKNQLEDELDTTESFEDDGLETIEEESQG